MTLTAILLALQGDDLRLHQFVFVPDKPAKLVSVAGSFNNWDKGANKMVLEADGRTWTTSIKLPVGKHFYKFVRDDNEWMVDPKAFKNEDDGNGNINSVLFIAPPDFGKPASPNDGEIAISALKHDRSSQFVNYDSGQLYLKLRARTNDLKSVSVKVGNSKVATEVATKDELYTTYKAVIKWDRKSDIAYSFLLNDGAASTEFGKTKLSAGFPIFEVPNWVQGSVIYQIFPDRFENGSKSNDSKQNVPWDTEPTYGNRYGGDVQGVSKRAGYLKDLGISAIYFNPIFKSPSNHRYEADSYMLVDPEFGTNSEYFKLSKDLKQSGIRTILDFAFNHTSPNYAQFNDLVVNGESSKFKSWYYPKSFPIKVGENPNYEAWFGFPSMPKLNTTNPETTEHLLKVCRFWIDNSNIDGMRLDVANEVDMNFWRKMRPYVKGLKRDLWIVGEIWGDGNPWLQGDQFDSVMNYQFRDAALKFVAKGTTKASEFANRLMAVHNSYPIQVSRNMMNLLGSHDTPRILNECNGDRDLAMLAATLQFTWIGAPSVYYGDELAMEGGRDPENRRGMRWDLAKSTNPMLAHYRKLVKLKKSVDALSTADVSFLMTDDNKASGAFVRAGKKDAAIVAFNRSDKEQKISFVVPSSVQVHAKNGVIDALTGNRYQAVSGRPINLVLKPKSAAVLVATSNSNLSPAPLACNYAPVNGDSAQSRANLIQEPLKTQ